uniref:Uncharacterized protein n=1 Tax=Salvator merianae TaxID=96440 RepID=A0A8D0BTK7_SALMN
MGPFPVFGKKISYHQKAGQPIITDNHTPKELAMEEEEADSTI